METIYDVLYYLKKFDFTENKNNTDYENLRYIKRILIKEFEDYNIPKLIDVLSIVVNLLHLRLVNYKTAETKRTL